MPQKVPLNKAAKPKRKSNLLRQALAHKKILENKGKVGPALVAAGYSKTYANNPQLFKGTKAYQDMLDALGLDNATLVKSHKELLYASTVDTMRFSGKMTDDEIRKIFKSMVGYQLLYIRAERSGNRIIDKFAYYIHPDNSARRYGLDMALKSKGAYKPEIVVNVNKYESMTQEELDRQIAEAEAKIKK